MLTDHVQTPPPLPSTFYPYIPKGVENIVLKALEKNPDDRFQNVEEFGAALEHPELWESYVPEIHGNARRAGSAGRHTDPVQSERANIRGCRADVSQWNTRACSPADCRAYAPALDWGRRTSRAFLRRRSAQFEAPFPYHLGGGCRGFAASCTGWPSLHADAAEADCAGIEAYGRYLNGGNRDRIKPERKR